MTVTPRHARRIHAHQNPAFDSPSSENFSTTSADFLLRDLAADPWGLVTPSVYETGRLVATAPWLPRHDQRLTYLVEWQRGDGGWGPPDLGYCLVPSLSAVDALLRVEGRPDVDAAADAGISFLRRALAAAVPLPDTPAIDLIVPSLLETLNQRLSPSLPIPATITDRRLRAVRRAARTTPELPTKLAHALEVLGPDARGRGHLSVNGAVGASPAATAAWLGNARDSAAYEYLASTVHRHDGPVPVCAPIATFERCWVLAALTRAEIPFTDPAGLLHELDIQLGPQGLPTAPGLPTDADTTAAALYVLARHGYRHTPDPLRPYERYDNYCTWPGEDGTSVTTNAHVLETLTFIDNNSGTVPSPSAAKLIDWLCVQQRPDGSWLDRWHASPYYATKAAALALHDHERTNPAARDAVRHARRWILDSQRVDGSWGIWAGSAEETAYALQTLIQTTTSPHPEVHRAVARGVSALEYGALAASALWHDKDLYRPGRIIAAEILTAVHLCGSWHVPGRGTTTTSETP